MIEVSIDHAQYSEYTGLTSFGSKFLQTIRSMWGIPDLCALTATFSFFFFADVGVARGGVGGGPFAPGGGRLSTNRSAGLGRPLWMAVLGSYPGVAGVEGCETGRAGQIVSRNLGD